MRFVLLPVIILCSLLAILPAAPVFAHNMLIEPVEPGKIRVIFEGGTPALYTEVIIYDERDEEITRGEVDRDGLFTYEIDGAAFIVAQDQFGHRAEYTVGEETGQSLPRTPVVIAVFAGFVLIAGVFQYRLKKRG